MADCDSSDVGRAYELVREMKRYYDDRAPWHDDYMSYTSREDMEATLKPVVDLVASQANGRAVLEIGCGTGNWTQILASHAKSVVAVDSSQSSLTLAESKVSRFDNCTLRTADIYTLDGIEGSFGLIYAADLLSHVPKKLIPHLMRTLLTKASEHATLTFLDMSVIQYFKDEESFVNEDGDRVSIRKLPNGKTYRVVKNFPDEPEVTELLETFGVNLVYRTYQSLNRWLVTFRTE